MQLETITRHIRAGDGSAALRGLLESWRTTRDPRLGAVIAELGERSDDEPAQGLVGRNDEPARQRWVDLARILPDEALTPFLNALVPHVETARLPWPVVVQLSQRPPDPRIASAALLLLRGRVRHNSRKLQATLVGCVERHGDPSACENAVGWENHDRAREVIEVIEHPRASSSPTLPGAQPEGVVAALRSSALRLVAPAPAPATVGDELLAAVYADPTDDGPRQVYGDWLSEQGDPRGEFVALQFCHRDGTLDSSGQKRMQALQRDHQQQWLAPIWPALSSAHRPWRRLVFERGFLVEATGATPAIAPSDLWDRPEWATVRSLGWLAFRRRGGPVQLGPVMRSLEALISAEPIVLRSPQPGLRRLEIPFHDDDLEWSKLPALEALTVGGRRRSREWIEQRVGRSSQESTG